MLIMPYKQDHIQIKNYINIYIYIYIIYINLIFIYY